MGRHAALIGELESLVAAHPYQERLHAQLILALYRSGRQAEALEAYQSVRRVLSEELGLQPGQALRELEAAILRQDETLMLDGRPARPSPAPTRVRAGAAERTSEDELRPVTVLFADIVGSTELGERLAPDEVKALVGECVTQMSQAVEEYGGHVQAVAGDGVCAYFGVPHVREDDPERAARTALRIQEVVGEYARDIAGGLGNPGLRRPRRDQHGPGRGWSRGRGESADSRSRRRDERRRPTPVGSGARRDRRRRRDGPPARTSLRVRAAR